MMLISPHKKSKSLPKTRTSKKFDFDFIIQYLKKQIIKKNPFPFHLICLLNDNVNIHYELQYSHSLTNQRLRI